MQKVIITGANGFIGSSLVMRMLKSDVEVYAIDIDFSRNRLPQSPLVHCIETGLEDVEKLVSLLQQAKQSDAFYHLAWRGVNGLEKANPSIQLDNAKMALDCAMVAKALDCTKFLCAGTVAEQSVHSLNSLEKTSGGMVYAVAKHCTHLILETYCKNIGLPFVWMQFSNSYGIGNRTGNLVSYTLSELMEGREPSFGPALQPYDFVYIDDLLEAVFRLGERETKRNFYFIGSGTPRILKEYLLEIGEITGRREAVKIGLRSDDGIKYDFSMFDTAPVKEAIGDYVSTPFEEGIKKTINWMKEC